MGFPAEEAGLALDSGGTPWLSVIMPAYNASATLPDAVAALRASLPPGAEVVVVVDGCLDRSAGVAEEFADCVVRRQCRGGASRCRNDGVRVARGDVLLFVDSDVTVTPEAVAGALRHIQEGADAVFGAYCALPPSSVANVATTHKNIVHHYTHVREGIKEASTFWSGFGCIRRDAFFAVGGFDCAVTKSADIEDVHLGYRLRLAGYRIVLDPTLQVSHHKRYTVRGVILSDIVHRAIPWTRAMYELRTRNRDLNLRSSELALVVLAQLSFLSLASTPFVGPGAGLVGAGSLGLWLAGNARFLRYVRRAAGGYQALASTALSYLYYLYAPLGLVLGLFALCARRSPPPTTGSLVPMLPPLQSTGELVASVAITLMPGEHGAFAALPPPSPAWELLVVAETAPKHLPAWATFVPVCPGTTLGERRDLGLRAAKGPMYATIGGSFVPDPGWLDLVCDAYHRGDLAVGGSFHDLRVTGRGLAYHLVAHREWRSNLGPRWLSHHPLSNFAVRTEVALRLGGFGAGDLSARLSRFGWHPIRFEPDMGVSLAAQPAIGAILAEIKSSAHQRVATDTDYRGFRMFGRILLIAAIPFFVVCATVRHTVALAQTASSRRARCSAVPIICLLAAAGGIGRATALGKARLWEAQPDFELEAAALHLDIPAPAEL